MSVHGLLAADLALDESSVFKAWNADHPVQDRPSKPPALWPGRPELQVYLPSPAAGS